MCSSLPFFWANNYLVYVASEAKFIQFHIEIELVNWLLHIAIEIWEISSHNLVLLVLVEVYYSTKAILSKISGQFFFLMYAFGPCTDDNRLYEWSKQQIYGKIWFLITNGMGMHLYLVTTSFCVQGCREVFLTVCLVS